VAERVDGSRQGNVVAVSVPGADTERILVLMETRESSHETLISNVKRAVHRELSLPVDVVCLRRGELPKTSSGKVQRHLTRQRYLQQAFSRATV
jgi:acyl-CoA synthetase (AMP-forming)/AMP-acid ligase II